MPDSQSFSIPFRISRRVEAALERWQVEECVARLWRGDASLWTGRDEARWLGWLRIVDEQRAHVEALSELSGQVRAEGFTHALLLGMGGSSLCPEVLRSTFGPVPGYPDLSVLDSTDPSQVRASLDAIDIERTLFLVSSKSGTTLESRILMEFFLERLGERVRASAVGARWIAITDPGTELEATAVDRGFRAVFPGRPDIGGRFSALSDFGMVPAAIMGLDVPEMLDRAAAMVWASTVPAPRNPAVALGIVLGLAAEAGRDKVTLVTSPGVAGIGGWLEQLLAESTGKNGKGLIPVDGEAPKRPDAYPDDRIFVYLRLAQAPDAGQDRLLAELEEAGQPVVRIQLGDFYDLGREFFRWEVATAVTGSILGLNPFDQPDVEASKVATRRLTAQYEADGALPAEPASYRDGDIALLGDSPEGAGGWGLADHFRAHLARIVEGDYFALLAYLEMNSRHRRLLEEIRRLVGERKRVATTLGFGPRFLHSTGQVHKGGPGTGIFLQITCDSATDVPVPGRRYTFGVVQAAQAAGDASVLAARGRRLLRAHLGSNVERNLGRLRDAIGEALEG